MRRTLTMVLGVAAAVCLGCLPPNSARPTAPSRGGAAAPAAQTPAPPPPPPGMPGPALPAAQPVAPAAQPPAQEGTMVKAQVGVGAKGHDLEPGFITTPISAYFSVRERLAYDVQIPEAMKLYKATNDRAPRSHEEFMREIIQANSIQLPKLPPGEEYWYDPQSEQLMVRRPAPR